MFDKLMQSQTIPLESRSEFFIGLKKEASFTLHPAGAAVGAVIGGGWAAHQAMGRHEAKASTGESVYSNQARHEMESYLERTQHRNDLSPMEKIEGRLITGKLRYARLAEKSPNQAIALESVLGAGAGAIGGSQVANAVGASKALALAKVGNALHIADAIGVSRPVLVKKAEYLGLSIPEVVEMEVVALGLSKKASLSEEDQAFLAGMKRTQEAVTGKHDPILKRAQVALPVQRAYQRLTEKKASLGELLEQKALEREQAQEIEKARMVEPMMAPQEPEDYRVPVREERRAALLDIFGGKTLSPEVAKTSQVKLAVKDKGTMLPSHKSQGGKAPAMGTFNKKPALPKPGTGGTMPALVRKSAALQQVIEKKAFGPGSAALFGGVANMLGTTDAHPKKRTDEQATRQMVHGAAGAGLGYYAGDALGGPVGGVLGGLIGHHYATQEANKRESLEEENKALKKQLSAVIAERAQR